MVIIESLPVMIILWIFAAFIFGYMFKTRKNVDKDVWTSVDETALGVLVIVFTILYPFIVLRFGNGYPGRILSELTSELLIIGNLLIVGVTVILIIWAISAKLRFKKNQNYRGYSSYEDWCKLFLEKYPTRSPLNRKVTHMLPIIVVYGLYIIVFLFQGLLGPYWESYAMIIIICIGLDFAIFFMLGDTARLYDFSWVPPNAAKLYMGAMTEHEIKTYTSTAAMVFGFAPFLFFNFEIFAIPLVITSLADAFAYIIGSTYGVPKGHFFPKSSKKTFEGYLAGIVFAFISVLIGSMFTDWSWEIRLNVGVVMAITFFLIDFLNHKIQDNYLNPLLCGLVLIIYLTIINVPIS